MFKHAVWLCVVTAMKRKSFSFSYISLTCFWSSRLDISVVSPLTLTKENSTPWRQHESPSCSSQCLLLQIPSHISQASWCPVPVQCFLPQLISILCFPFILLPTQYKIFTYNLLWVSIYEQVPSSFLLLSMKTSTWLMLDHWYRFLLLIDFPHCVVLNSCFSPSHTRRYFKKCSSSVLMYLSANSVLHGVE